VDKFVDCVDNLHNIFIFYRFVQNVY